MAGVAQWIEFRPENKRVTGLIPTQGTCLGCGPGAQLGTRKRQPFSHTSMLLSLSFSLSSPLPKNK